MLQIIDSVMACHKYISPGI